MYCLANFCLIFEGLLEGFFLSSSNEKANEVVHKL